MPDLYQQAYYQAHREALKKKHLANYYAHRKERLAGMRRYAARVRAARTAEDRAKINADQRARRQARKQA